MPVLWLLIIGTAAGFLATRLMKVDLDIPTTIVLGVLGALVGGFALRALVFMAGIGAGFIGALLGALGLIWAWQKWRA